MIKNAKPIWLDSSFDNQYIEAVRSFEVQDTKNARLQICADAGYTAYINENFVGFGQFRGMPGKKFYDEYDISSFLRNGENTLRIEAYYQGHTTSCYAHDKANLSFAVILEQESVLSDSNTLVRPHPNYKSGELELVTFQLGYVFEYNAKGEEYPFRQACLVEDFSPEYIKRPIRLLDILPTEEGKIKTQGIMKRETKGTYAQMMQRDFLSYRDKKEIFDGKTVKKQENGAYFVIDLGKELAGHFTLDIDAPEGTVIDIGYGEHLDDMRVRTHIDFRNFACRYIACGKDSFTAYFLRFAGRYISLHITNMTDDVKIEKIGLVPVDYPVARKADFRCSDYLFEKLYDVSVDTLKLCMHEHYEDCPWREQSLYAYDSFVQMLCGYYAFGEYEFARASLDLLADGLREDGLLNLTSPGLPKRTIPSFSLAYILSLEKYLMYSGDGDFVRGKLLVCKGILDAFKLENNLVVNNPDECYWHFFEWTKILEDMDHSIKSDACTNFYYVLAAKAYDRMCEHFGKEGSGINTDAILAAANSTFYDKNEKLYKTIAEDDTYHELTQALAYLAGATDDDYVLDCLISDDSRLVKATLSTSLFKYDALMTKREKYIDRISDEIAKIWGDMLFCGATSLWETSDGADAFRDAGSLCHAWSAVPVYLFYKYYMGFEPTSPGFESFTLSPISTLRGLSFETDLLTPIFSKRVKVCGEEIFDCE